MKLKITPPRFEDAYRQHQFAPLVALAMALADWVKKRRADKPANHRIAGIGGSSRDERTSR